MKNCIIRSATQQDMPQLLGCEQGIVTAERPFDETLKPGKIHYYDISVLIDSEKGEVVVAESEGKIVASGFVEILPAKPYLIHDQYAHLGFMFVDPAFRGQGLNKQIVDALLKWSKSKGLTEVRLDVYADNQAAISAYEKAGFSSHLVEMRCQI